MRRVSEQRRVRRSVPVIVLTLVALVGCSDGTVSLDGQLLVEGNKPQTVAREVFKVSLLPSAAPGDLPNSTTAEQQALSATVQPDGTFKLDHVTPGDYRVAVADFVSYPSGDRLASYFRNHPDAVHVTVGKGRPLIIDLERDWFQREPNLRRGP